MDSTYQKCAPSKLFGCKKESVLKWSNSISKGRYSPITKRQGPTLSVDEFNRIGDSSWLDPPLWSKFGDIWAPDCFVRVYSIPDRYLDDLSGLDVNFFTV